MSDESSGHNPRPNRKPSSRNIARPGEFDFINHIRQRGLKRGGAQKTDSSLITRHSSLICGIGDDAAVLRGGTTSDTLVTADLLVEDVDFRLRTTTPRLLGHKALAVSLSDIAAMGGRPRWALLSLGVPPRVWRGRFLDEFYEGFYHLADEHGVTLVGGDVSRTPGRLVVDSIVLGEVRRGRAVTRAGARPGDGVYVTGALGGAAAGLRLLESAGRPKLKALEADRPPDEADEDVLPGGAARRPRPGAPSRGASAQSEARRRLLLRQLRPAPRVAWGAWLGEKRLATAMIDTSDGLSSDLAHLCRESGVGATLEAARVPLDPSIERAGLDVADALRLALHGGEDFELLFTVRPRDASKLPEEVGGVPVNRVGEITDARGGVRLVEGGRARSLKPAGFEHFGRARR